MVSSKVGRLLLAGSTRKISFLLHHDDSPHFTADEEDGCVKSELEKKKLIWRCRRRKQQVIADYNSKCLNVSAN